MKMHDMLTSAKTVISSVSSRMSFTLNQNAPSICLAVGIGGVVAAGIIACVQTLKVPAMIEDVQEQEQKLKETADKTVEVVDGDIVDEDEKETALADDIRKMRLTTGVAIAKLYIPAIIIATCGFCLIVHSHYQMAARNVALYGAYLALQKEFDEYRENVKERFGEDVDKQLRFNVNPDKIREQLEGEADTPSTALIEARTRFLFDENNSDLYQKNMEYNIHLISIAEHNLNHLLRANGHIFVNEALAELHLPLIQSGQDNGWIYDPMVEHKIVLSTYYVEDDNRGGIWIEMNIDGDIRHSLQAA